MKYELGAIIPIGLLITFIVVLIMITIHPDKSSKVCDQSDFAAIPSIA